MIIIKGCIPPTYVLKRERERVQHQVKLNLISIMLTKSPLLQSYLIIKT